MHFSMGALECFALCSFMLFMPQITVYIFLLGFKRYGCPNCSRNYCSKSNLSRHLQKECGKLLNFNATCANLLSNINTLC